MNRKLKVAVVGAAFAHSPDGRERHAVRTHVPVLKKLSDLFELTAICTTRMETASETAQHFGVPYAFDNVERMLAERPELDVVCVSVQPRHHHKVVMPALRAGKHVYCEHPMGAWTHEAEEMYRVAREKNVRTIVGHQSYYEPAILHMAELAQQGYIGELLTFGHSTFEPNYIMPRPAHRQWLFQRAAGGRMGYRSGHGLETVLSVIGRDIAEISSDMRVLVPERRATDTGGVIKSDAIDNINHLIRFGDRLMGTMQISITAWFGTGIRFELYGTEGMLMLSSSQKLDNWTKEEGKGDPTKPVLRLYGARVDMDRLLKEQLPPERLQKEFREIEIPDRLRQESGFAVGGHAFAVARAWRAFAEAIHSGGESHPNFADVLKIHYVLDAAEKSTETRAWQRVDYGLLAS